MANLKLDLLNKLRNEKYYEELELVRLAQEPNMNYAEKIDGMIIILENLAILNSQMGLMEQYFNEPEQAPAQGQPVPQQPAAPVEQAPVVEKPAPKAHKGQSHGE